MLQGFKNWLAQPFASNQDAFHWFLFMGLLVVIMALWRLILSHVHV